MRLVNAHVGNKRQKVNTRRGSWYQVRWVVDPGAGRNHIERKRSTFRTIGECDAFIDRLNKAGLQLDGWCFDHKGEPMQGTADAVTVVRAASSYVASRWSTDWQEGQRSKAFTVLKPMIIHTLVDAKDRERLLVAYGAQARNRGARREPSTPPEWAARWLRDVGLHPHLDEQDDPGLQQGRDWIEQRSLRLDALDVDIVTRVRTACVGGTPNSERTYWGVAKAFLEWIHETGLVDTNPLRGVKKIRRDIAAERPDPKDILDPSEVALIAEDMGRHHGAVWELWVLVTTFCALRIGESLAVTGASFWSDNEGRWFLNATKHRARFAKGVSDDGVSTRRDADAKSSRDRTPSDRDAPVPDALAQRLVAHFGDALGTSTRPLFVGPRGAVGNQATVRKWWHASVRRALGDDHRRANAVPHAANFALERGRLLHVMLWEDLTPAFGRAQARLNVMVDQCDLFVGLLHTRWGTPTGAFSSGFEEEFARARARRERTGWPDIAVYFKSPGDVEDDDVRRIQEFRESISQSLTYGTLDNPLEWQLELSILFHNLVSDDAHRDPSEIRSRLRTVVRSLPDREKLVLSLLYDENLDLAEIGAVLNLEPARIDQIHSKAIQTLASELQLGDVTEVLRWIGPREG